MTVFSEEDRWPELNPDDDFKNYEKICLELSQYIFPLIHQLVNTIEGFTLIVMTTSLMKCKNVCVI